MVADVPEVLSCNLPGTVRSYPFHIVARPTASAIPAKDAVEGLRKALRTAGSTAEVIAREDEGFGKTTAIFNGAVHSQAYASVKPKSAYDVSKTIMYCQETGLELSVKAGGTGVHGWSVSGHIVLDLSLMTQVSVSSPSEPITLHESFESLRIADSGKRPSLSSTTASGSSSTMTSKRSASDVLDGRDEGRGRRKLDLEDILEGGSGPAGPSVQSPLDAGATDSPEGVDVNMDADLQQQQQQHQHQQEDSRKSSKSSSADPSGSSRQSSNGADNAESSTAPTSLQSVGMMDWSALRQSSRGGSSSSGSGSSSRQPPQQARTTYVNPSPTAVTSFPFIPTAFGSSSSSSASQTFFSSGFPTTSQSLQLNTNPDPPAYTLVSFGAGTTSKMLDAATATSPYGAFYVPTSAFPVGSGQFLSGGFGFIGRKHGLAMDNLVEAEVVLADGRIVWVGENGKHQGDWKDDEDPEEVWWGLRGAGATLGVVTRFRAKAYYLPSIYAGNMIFAFSHATTPSLLRHVRDCIKGSPRTLYCNIIMTAGPPNAPGIVVIQLCFSGSRAEGEMYVQAMSAWEGGRSIFQDFSERTFERQQVAVEEILKGGQGRKWYIKSDMLMSLNDEVIDQTCEKFHAVPDGCTWLFEFTGGGAVADVKDSCFPSSHREGAFTVAALHQWGHDETPVEDSLCVTTAEDWINEVIHPHGPGGPLPCESDEAAVAAVYGENYERLKALKHKIDPDNFFRHAMWPHRSGHDEELDSLHKGKAGINSAKPAAGKDDRSAAELTHGRAKTVAEMNDLSNDLSFNKSQTIENVAIDAYRSMASLSGKVEGKEVAADGKEHAGGRMVGNIPDGPDGTLVVDMDVRLSRDAEMQAKGFGPPKDVKP